MSIPFTCPPKIGDCAGLSAHILRDSQDFTKVEKIIPQVFDDVDYSIGFWKSLLRNNITVILRLNGGIVGFSNIDLSQRTEPNASRINLLGVLPKHQGKGFGKLLLGISERISKESQLRVVRLHTEQRKPQNVAFYSKEGFQVINFVPNYYGPRIGDGLYMEKIITSRGASRNRSNRRPPRKERGHKCAQIFGKFPERITCENLEDVLPLLRDVREWISDTEDLDTINCLDRMGNKISSKCRNKLIKPIVTSLKREVNQLVRERKTALK